MILKDFLNKALDYDLDKVIKLDNGNGSSTEIKDIIECTDENGDNIVCIKTANIKVLP